MKICIVASNFYPKITKLLIKGAESVLNRAREQGTRQRAMNRALENIEESSATND